MPRPILYTVGHSTHAIEYFLELLTTYTINCVVDVRSVAASRFNPQYNKQRLAASLKDHNITYLHFADEFGARQTNPTVLDDTGKVDFEKVRRSENFRRGVDRIEQGVKKGYVIALMCAESEPLDCHRFSMVSVALRDHYDIRHILKDKTIMTQTALEEILLKKYADKIQSPGMFEVPLTREQRLELSYRLKNKEIGFSE